jgi:cysteine-rich repeat protein
MDKTALKQDYLEYRFTTGIWWTNITTVSVYIPYSHSHGFQNYVFGLSKMVLRMNYDPSFSFSLAKNSGNNNVDFGYNGLNTTWLAYVYSYAVFPFITCTVPSFPYLNLTDGYCYARCSRLQYVGSARVCSSCRFDCLTCYNSTRCSSCNLTNRYLEPSNLSCLPKEGYYESNDFTPFTCTPPCRTCLNNGTFCTSCLTNTSLFFGNNSCLLCSYLLEGCDTCNSTYCFTCLSPYRLVTALYCNLPCRDSNCAVCSNANTSFCYTCNTRYFRANPAGLCVATCGDGYVQSSEQCDDGNDIQHDGCHYCAQEPYYQCYNTLDSIGRYETLYCAYTKPIEFSVVST